MRRRKSPVKTILFLIILAAAAFIGIRMATVPTDLAVNQTLELPQSIDLASIVSGKQAAQMTTEAATETATETTTAAAKAPLAAQSTAKYAVAVDDNLVYTSSDAPQPIASTAKMVLALMIMEKHPFSLPDTGEIITITPEFYQIYQQVAAEGGSYVPVEEGETLSEYDALAGTLIASANNLADSFTYAKDLVDTIQANLAEVTIATAGQEVGNYDSWWTGQIPIHTDEDIKILNWQPATPVISLDMIGNQSSTSSSTQGETDNQSTATSSSQGETSAGNATSGTLNLTIGSSTANYAVKSPEFASSPDLFQRFQKALSF